MSRLFVAALPDERAVEALRGLTTSGQPGVRPVPEEQWHVTLRFIGDADLDTTIDLLGHARLPAARAVLGPTIERLGSRQIVLPADGVDELAHAVREATAPVGRHGELPFRGHLTLARTEPEVTSRIEGVAFETAWVVTEIALVTSELRPTGAVHTTVATFPTGRPVAPRRG